MTTQTRDYRKLSPELIGKLSGYIAKGSYAVTACAACGINVSTLYSWKTKAEQDIAAGRQSLEIDLVEALEKAQAICEHELASMIRETALDKREWLPAMTFLERRHPDRWGRKDRSQVTIDEHKTVTITHVEVIKPQGYIEGESRELIGEGDATE